VKKSALLVLADGNLFWGESVGAAGMFTGEVVFNTAMTGYEEILTDPSYGGQMITFTYPHIGNVGINYKDAESQKTWAGGAILRASPTTASSWRAQKNLKEFLREQKMLAISDVDTRYLTHLLREKGSQKGCLMTEAIDQELALTQASAKFHVVVIDFGVKGSILKNLVISGCSYVLVTPFASLQEILSHQPDGILISNGPGNPSDYKEAITMIALLLHQNVPIFGICLGLQLLARASGAMTEKMKFGHHGANHPIIDLATKKVFVSSQNHNFVVSEKNLPQTLKITHRSLFDGSIAGIEKMDAPAFGFQGHPEASPGPNDLQFFFQKFVHLMEGCHGKTH
jgi:carbamoyl-phosphate synthase small subunit